MQYLTYFAPIATHIRIFHKDKIKLLRNNRETQAKKGKKPTYHGSNSWMILSNRMTAKRRLAKPTSHANDRMVNVRRDCHPTVCVFASVESTFRSFVADASFRSTTSILDEEATFLKINQSAVTSCEICFSLSHSTFTVSTWDGSLLFFSLNLYERVFAVFLPSHQ